MIGVPTVADHWLGQEMPPSSLNRCHHLVQSLTAHGLGRGLHPNQEQQPGHQSRSSFGQYFAIVIGAAA